MITIISGSNRKNNLTVHFATYIFKYLQGVTDIKVRFIDLSKVDSYSISETMYDPAEQHTVIKNIQNDYIIPASKFWFFVPEYNGSYPGIVKLVLDAISVRNYKESFSNKKACITGIASGRAGNLRGMDHLAEVLNHLGIHVHPNKNPISSIHHLIDEKKGLVDDTVTANLEKQAHELLNF